MDKEGALCQKKLENTSALEKIFSVYRNRLLEEKRAFVEKYATEVFLQITNAPQKYKGIKIAKDYSLLLELTNGETYQIEPGRTLNPSTGQSKVIFVLPAALQQGVDVVSGVFQAILVQHTGPAHAGQVIVLGYHDIPGAHSVDQSEDQAVSALIEHQRLGRFSLDAMGRVAEDERWHPVTFAQADGQVYHRQPSALINTVGMARLLCLFCRLYS